jgi:predicted RecB family nuclease
MYRYVEKFQPDVEPHLYTILGQATHAALHQMYLDDTYTLDHLLNLWPKAYEKEILESKIVGLHESVKRRWFNVGVSALTKFHEVALAESMLVKPVQTEWPFECVVSAKSGQQYKIIGFVDLIIRVGDDVLILDFKSGSYQVTKAELKSNEQLTIYSMAVRKVLGLTEKRVGLFYLRTGKILWDTRTESDYEKVIEDIDATWKKIAAKEFEPSYQTCRLCNFQGRCAADDWEKRTGVSKNWVFAGEVK